MISVDTGEVLDYDFKSKLCMECTRRREMYGEESDEYKAWFDGHKDKCTRTHTGSSGSMECSIAKKIWARSLDYKLKYKFIVCDSDSKAYNSVWDTYGCCDDC